MDPRRLLQIIQPMLAGFVPATSKFLFRFMMAASAADIPEASDSRHRKIQAGNRLRSVAQRVMASQEARHLGSHRAACGLSASSRGATQHPQDRAAIACALSPSHTINLGGGDLVEVRYPIARLDLPTLAKHCNGCPLRLLERQRLTCPIAHSCNPSLPCAPWPADFHQPART